VAGTARNYGADPGGDGVIKRLIGRAAVWAGKRRGAQAARCSDDPRPKEKRYIAVALSDEALESALNTWSKRYL
jgi:hypothetical protein